MAFHDFSRSLCRLSRSSKFQPLFPIRPAALSKAEVVIKYDSVKTQPASTNSNPNFNERDSVPQNIKYWQKYYQENEDKPVYLMRGAVDKILFGTSCFGLVIGLIMSFQFLWPQVWVK